MRLNLLIAIGLIPLAGCATVTRGTTNQVQFLSEPQGAAVRTSLNHSCMTPCTLQIGRKDEFAVTFSKPGFLDQTIEVKTQLAGAGAAGFAGNIVAGGIVGMGVDAYTGATLQHLPNPVRVILQAAPMRPVSNRPHRRGRGLTGPAS